MKTITAIALLFLSSVSQAALVTWELNNFSFDDGGSAYGSFIYDTENKSIHNIDVYTTPGSRLNGRHYIANAGSWGSHADIGIMTFTDTDSTNDYRGAGWFRMDFHSISNVTSAGVSLDQWLAVGGESYCVNIYCSSAANEITDPQNSRETISGYIYSTQSIPNPVPLPASAWLFLSALSGIGWISRKKRNA